MLKTVFYMLLIIHVFFTHAQLCFQEPSVPLSLRLIVTGAPGSGKSRISSELKRNFNMTVVSSGNILRQEAKKDSELGMLINRTIHSGRLVSDDIVTDLVTRHLATAGPRWVLDGFPRTLAQAEMLHAIVGKLDAVLHLDIPFSVIEERLADRLVHMASGRTYHRKKYPPKIPGKDDVTGEPLQRRPDDAQKIVEVRLELYATKAQPILKFYRNLGVVKDFWNIDQVWPEIKAYLEQLIRWKKPLKFKTLFDGRKRNCLEKSSLLPPSAGIG